MNKLSLIPILLVFISQNGFSENIKTISSKEAVSILFAKQELFKITGTNNQGSACKIELSSSLNQTTLTIFEGLQPQTAAKFILKSNQNLSYQAEYADPSDKTTLTQVLGFSQRNYVLLTTSNLGILKVLIKEGNTQSDCLISFKRRL